MPEITITHVILATVMTLIGIVVGWTIRSKRCRREKSAVNAGWQTQIEAQRLEHGRLVEQNKSLMQQINQYQASSKDATNRAKELSVALQEAFERRDALQREIKDIRANLDSVLAERQGLQNDVDAITANDKSLNSALKEKDDKIFKMSRQLESWQERLPPLIQRFRERNDEAERLEAELAETREKMDGLEAVIGSEHTRVEAVNPDSLPDGMVASNDPLDTSDVRGQRLYEGNGAGDTGQHAEYDDRSATDSPVELRDDLKQIKGVGPAIERTLNELGIFRFSQIAEMSEYEIDRVASHLKGFRSRIYREDWIGQARELQNRR